MGLGKVVTRRAQEQLAGQLMPHEVVVLSTNLAASAMLLTDRRLMIAPAVRGAEPEINVPLHAVHNVAWKKGMLGSPGTLEVHTSGQAHRYRVRNSEGEQAAQLIRQAIAAAG